MKAILYALLAAVFYAINIPASKVLLRDVGPTTMAALLYLGAGIGSAVYGVVIARMGYMPMFASWAVLCAVSAVLVLGQKPFEKKQEGE
jgi:predicted MFS family arabinose efflux permease